MALSPIEFAAGRGHAEYPVLSAIDSPASRVPCVDFSPWLADRIATGDQDAVARWTELVIEANPGVGIGAGPDHPLVVRSRGCVASPLSGLRLSDGAGLDLRTALTLVNIDGGGPRFGLVNQEHPRFLAAAMSPWPVNFDAMDRGIAAANRVIAEMQAEEYPAWADVQPVTDADVAVDGPAYDEECVTVLRRLSVISRSHVADLAQLPAKRLDAVNDQRGWEAWYATRSRGCDPEQGVQALVDVGVLAVATDAAQRRAHVEKDTTAAAMRDLLDVADVSYPKSAAKGRLVALLDEHRPGLLDEMAAAADLYRLTPLGRRTVEWQGLRVQNTMMFWTIWLVTTDPDVAL